MKDFHEFAWTLALWKKGGNGHDVALLLTESFDIRVAKSTHDTRPVTGSAVINAIQSALSDNLRLSNAWIYSSAEPTEACKGMARLQTRGGKVIYRAIHNRLVSFNATRRAPGLTNVGEYYWNWPEWCWAELGGVLAGLATVDNKIAKIESHGQEIGKFAWTGWHRSEQQTWLDFREALRKLATRVKNCALHQGRASGTLGKFVDPGTMGHLDIALRLQAGFNRDHFYSLLAQELVHETRDRTAGTSAIENAGHNIGCLIVDGKGTLVGWGVNTNKTNGSFHGETNAIQALETRPPGTLPPGGTLYTSLEPCEMCSGIIRTALSTGDRAFRVIFSQADETLQDTALNATGSPIAMKAAAVVHDETGFNYATELALRQEKLVDKVNPGFKAPTKFVAHTAAVEVFLMAGKQRERMSKAEADATARVHAQRTAERQGYSVISDERAQITEFLKSEKPSLVDLKRYGTRDDRALPQSHFEKMQFTAPTPRMPTTPLNLRRSVDDWDVRPPSAIAPKPVDPRLRALAQRCDAMSLRFRTEIARWMNAEGAACSDAEVKRLLAQISDFINMAKSALL